MILLKESNQAYAFILNKMEVLQFWKTSTCVATLQQELSSPCRRQSGQECQCVPQDYRRIWNGEEDHNHHHHPGTTEILSISILKARYHAQKMCAGFLEILCATRGEKLRALICPRAVHSCWEWKPFPLERQRQRSSPILLTSGLTEIAGDTEENKSIDTFWIHINQFSRKK